MKKYFFHFILIIFLFLSGCNFEYNQDYKENNNKNYNLDYDIDFLLNNVYIGKANDLGYDRDSYESPKRRFECPETGKKESIRLYSMDKFINFNFFHDDDSFNFIDPYSGEFIDDIDDIEYDHIIPLHYVDMHGGYYWENDVKNEYAFNINNGLPVSKKENRKKSDKGPSEYLPDVNQEDYCYSWLIIAYKYDISLDEEDFNTIKYILQNTDETIELINPYEGLNE